MTNTADSRCPSILLARPCTLTRIVAAPKPLPWGHPSLIGLGFSVYVTTLLVELFGSPLLRNASVAVGLVVGAIIASATGYIDSTPILAAPQGTFLWTTTFPLGLSGSLVI